MFSVGKALLRFILNYTSLTNSVNLLDMYTDKFLKQSNSSEWSDQVPVKALNKHHKFSYSRPAGNGEKELKIHKISNYNKADDPVHVKSDLLSLSRQHLFQDLGDHCPITLFLVTKL